MSLTEPCEITTNRGTSICSSLTCRLPPSKGRGITKFNRLRTCHAAQSLGACPHQCSVPCPERWNANHRVGHVRTRVRPWQTPHPRRTCRRQWANRSCIPYRTSPNATGHPSSLTDPLAHRSKLRIPRSVGIRFAATGYRRITARHISAGASIFDWAGRQPRRSTQACFRVLPPAIPTSQAHRHSVMPHVAAPAARSKRMFETQEPPFATRTLQFASFTRRHLWLGSGGVVAARGRRPDPPLAQPS